MSRRGRLSRGILLGALAAATLAGCAAGSRSPHPRAHVRRVATHVPVATTHAVTTPLPPSPALSALQAALLAQLRAAGPASGAVVFDLTTGQPLFSLRGTIGRPPASVEKLYTSVAVMKDLGGDTRLQTTVLGSGHLAPGGVWEGNLYLRGGGDPTFGDSGFNQAWNNGYGPNPQQLTAQLLHAGIRRVTGLVIGDESLFDARRGGPNTGYAPDLNDLGGQLSALTYDHGSTTRRLGPAEFAVREFALTLHDSGIQARPAGSTAAAPPGAQPLASVSSPPTSMLVRLMDLNSDDFIAELLTKQLGVRFGGAGSTAAGASVIAGAVAGYGVSPTIVDGSGLSRQDVSSPQQIVDLLRAVHGTAIGQALQASLPVVGVNGTARGIALHTPAQGHCTAKTGSLNYVTNLAGYCRSRGGDQLAFALLLDGPTNSRGFALIGRMVAAIARY